MSTCHLEYINLCINDFFKDTTKLRSDYKCKENRQLGEHIPHKTQKCKGIHSTDQAEIIQIDSLYSADLKKCWELILVSLVVL